MKEYTIKMKFSVESEKANLGKISQFAEELSRKILDDDNFTYSDDIEIIDKKRKRRRNNSDDDDSDIEEIQDETNQRVGSVR